MSSTASTNQENGIQAFFTSPQFGAICGILGPSIGFLCVGVAIFLSPWFIWATNALSDLGHPTMLGGIDGVPGLNPAAPVFNIGLIVTGLVTIVFGIHLLIVFWKQKSFIGLIGAIVIILSMAFLSAVGVFHEGLLWPHAIVAMGFFFGLFIATLLIGIALLIRRSTRYEGIITLAMGMGITSTLVVWFMGLLPWSGAAIPEIILAIAGFIWIIPVSIRLYRFGYVM
jgi:hypothetical membrane protein